MWLMRRLKRLAASNEGLLDTYIKQIRSILELADPLWHPALPVIGIKLIQFKSQHQSTLRMNTLEARRETLCLNFALQASTHPTFKDWFKDFKMSRPRYVEPYTRTGRFENFPISQKKTIQNHIVWKKTKSKDGSEFCPNVTVTSVQTLYYVFPAEL